MSATHQAKKARQAHTFDNWVKGKKRAVDGVVYATRKDARLARAEKRNRLK
jgi:hypothetical protein